MTVTSTASGPFLVARGRRHDYRCIVAPPFLADPAGRAFLADNVRIGDTAGPATVDHRTDAPNGPVTLVYRAYRITSADLTDGPPLDEHGRALYLMYGLAHQGWDVSPDDVGQLADTLADYRRFLATEDTFPEVVRHPIRQTQQTPTPTPTPTSTPRSSSGQPLLRYAALMAAGVALGLSTNLARPMVMAASADPVESVIAGSPGTAVDFIDTSDSRHRTIEVTCEGRSCRILVPCDHGHIACANLSANLPANRTRTANGYQFDAAGQQHAAMQVEQLFLTALNASTDYQLAWTSPDHPDPAPIQR